MCEQMTDVSFSVCKSVGGGGTSDSRQHLIGPKIWRETEVRCDVMKIHDPF